MITEYIKSIMEKAKYEIVEDDGTYYGYIPWAEWVWANADTLEECRTQLQEVFEEWLLIKIRKVKFAPKMDSYSLNDIVCQN